MSPVIRVENLSKCYTLKHQGQSSGNGLRHALEDAVSAPFRRGKGKSPVTSSSEETFWALKDVSFEVNQGEVLGIIGRNGAGKSTLLKVLSRITEPTKGRAGIKGRVASLLEVGTGFHPELSGRENIFLNGAILGMTRAEIRGKFDEIVAFAEVERFLDTPVKRYSSGMYVRLAFAVAAHLEPEILIVDEVLAVGDAQFQRKCLGKMDDIARNTGRTILFVSHNMAAVRGICSRAICLSKGRVVMEGDKDDVIRQYLQAGEVLTEGLTWEGENQLKSQQISFKKAWITNEADEPTSWVSTHERFSFVLEYDIPAPSRDLIVGFDLQNADGILVCGSNTAALEQWHHKEAGKHRVTCAFPGHLLNEGRYSLRFIAHNASTVFLTSDFSLHFEVRDLVGHGTSHTKVHGVIRPQLTWTLV